jgi:hypothetical protein
LQPHLPTAAEHHGADLEINAHRGHKGGRKLVVAKAQQQAGFSHSAIANHYQLKDGELGHGIQAPLDAFAFIVKHLS